ncbi:hypothetical protein [Streptomyces sp. CB02959]|uniref:hypothetical protein n=1 Tax=Streptomyces sp. CB02959 TaxID=2020330 RepID=UPI0015E14365|nr:hypothetical protein [Streptomyces sp. CB02959]
MPSALGLLEAKESAGREAVERAREGAARVAALLDEAERPLERLVIAREAVVEVLAEPVARVAPRRRCRGGMRAKDLAAPLGLGGGGAGEDRGCAVAGGRPAGREWITRHHSGEFGILTA